MPQVIEVPNFGPVEFPDDMSDAEIVAAIKRNGLNYKTEPVKIGKDAYEESLRQTLQEAPWGVRNIASAGTSLSNIWEGAKQFVGAGDQDAIRNNQVIRDEAPVGAIAGDMALTAVPFGMAGNSVKAAGAIGAGYGALQPVDGDSIAKGKLLNTAFGGVLGAAGQGAANKLASSVSSKLASIEQKVKEKAAQVAEKETLSARSAAGNAAQDAYRQLEHLRALGFNRPLTQEESMTVAILERELAEKALDKLMPAAARKQATADAFKEAVATEQARAAQYAAEKLSSKEAKDQFMARLKRYGPAAAGGIVGNMIFPGLGGSVGGAATGLVLRPALRSMKNLAKNPAVQHGLLSPLENSLLFRSPAMPTTSLLLGDAIAGQ